MTYKNSEPTIKIADYDPNQDTFLGGESDFSLLLTASLTTSSLKILEFGYNALKNTTLKDIWLQLN